MHLMTNRTPILLWQDLVRHGEAVCCVTLQKEEEAYLVTLLSGYANKPEMVKLIIAKEFMEGMQSQGAQRILALRKVGDQCLLFSGLFPQIATKKHVKIGYFVDMGQSAYASLAKTTDDLYNSLATHFVVLMDVLQSIRQYDSQSPDLLPFAAYDQWNEVGSQRALHILRHYTSCIPIKK
jgi:hypothetical protein